MILWVIKINWKSEKLENSIPEDCLSQLANGSWPLPCLTHFPSLINFLTFLVFLRRMMGARASFYFLSQQWLQYCEKMDVVTRERWRSSRASLVASCCIWPEVVVALLKRWKRERKKGRKLSGIFQSLRRKAAIVTLASHNNFQIDFPGHFGFFWVGSKNYYFYHV